MQKALRGRRGADRIRYERHGPPGPARHQSAERRQPRGNLSRRRFAVPHPGRRPQPARTRTDARNIAPPHPRRRNGDPHRPGPAPGRRRQRAARSDSAAGGRFHRSRPPADPAFAASDRSRVAPPDRRSQHGAPAKPWRAVPISAFRSPMRWSPATHESVLLALVRNATAKISDIGYKAAGGEIPRLPGPAGAADPPPRHAQRPGQQHVRLGLGCAEGLYPEQLSDGAARAWMSRSAKPTPCSRASRRVPRIRPPTAPRS